MKKILVFILSVAVIFSATSCGSSELKTDSIVSCENFSIKFSTATDSTKTFSVAPQDLDWDALKEKGYKSVRITVNYKVRFEKQWNIGLGYLGVPRYDVSILNPDGVGESRVALETDTESKSKAISRTMLLEEVAGKEMTLTFATTNMQNLISFEDVKVEYTVKK